MTRHRPLVHILRLTCGEFSPEHPLDRLSKSPRGIGSDGDIMHIAE